MQILQLHNRYRQAGGEDGVVAAEADLLRRHGHVVREFVADNREIGRFGGVRAAVLGIWNRRAYTTVRRLIREHGIEVVHAHNLFPLMSPAVYYAARQSGVPVVQTLHNYRLACPNSFMLRDNRVCTLCLGRLVKTPAVRYACYRDNRVASTAVALQLGVHHLLGSYREQVTIFIALTQFAKSMLTDEGLPAERICLKPNFVARDLQPGLGLGGYALFVGRLSPEKGIQVMLDAWSRRSDLPPLIIAGDGPEVRRVVAAATLDPRVQYVGRRTSEQVVSLMQDAVALIFPSIWFEGMPLTLLEAFACGTPVVASRVGGLPEIVAENVSGTLFAPGDPNALAEAIARLWREPDKRATLASGARTAYERQYSASANYSQLMSIYAEAIGRRSIQPAARRL